MIYIDGLNLYRYSRDNPAIFADPEGSRAWIMLSENHASIVVEVHSDNWLYGWLAADYHCHGYFNDGTEARRSSGGVTRGRGRVQLSFRPNDSEFNGKLAGGHNGSYPFKLLLNGTRTQDDKLIDYLLATAFQNRSWFRCYDEFLAENFDALGIWEIYSVTHNRTCIQYVYDAAWYYLGRPPSAARPELLFNPLGWIGWLEDNFDSEGNWTGKADAAGSHNPYINSDLPGGGVASG